MSNINFKYYTENSNSFIEGTIKADMSKQYEFFLKYLPKTGTILDLGFGSGRDSLYFQKLGYDVYALDPIKEFCDNAKKIGINNVCQSTVQDMNFEENKFDGIWACASLLHVSEDELNEVFKKCSKILKPNGAFYASFKYGDFRGERNGRYFTDLTETSIVKYLENTGLKIVETVLTDDVRPERNDRWLNVILKK